MLAFKWNQTIPHAWILRCSWIQFKFDLMNFQSIEYTHWFIHIRIFLMTDWNLLLLRHISHHITYQKSFHQWTIAYLNNSSTIWYRKWSCVHRLANKLFQIHFINKKSYHFRMPGFVYEWNLMMKFDFDVHTWSRNVSQLQMTTISM